MGKDIPLKVEMLSTLDDNNYRIFSAREIELVLHHIAQKGARVALYYGDANDFILTTMLDVGNKGLWLEQSSNATDNLRILDSNKLVFVSSHLQVKIQFAATRVSNVEYQGYPAFFLPLPDSIYRLQRREYYRLMTQVSEPLRCVIAAGKPVFKRLREFIIMDISGGGLGLACTESDTDLVPGATYPDCRIELPEVGVIVGTIEVKNLFLLTSPSGQAQKCAGCEFKNMDPQHIILLQRYVTNMQRAKTRNA